MAKQDGHDIPRIRQVFGFTALCILAGLERLHPPEPRTRRTTASNVTRATWHIVY